MHDTTLDLFEEYHADCPARTKIPDFVAGDVRAIPPMELPGPLWAIFRHDDGTACMLALSADPVNPAAIVATHATYPRLARARLALTRSLALLNTDQGAASSTTD